MCASATATLPGAAGEAFDEDRIPRLSTDYLNRHSEALMLIEMVPVDRETLGELAAWRGVGYVEHFEQSPLRCAAEAIAAYRSLGEREAIGFEHLCAAMNRLVDSATALLAGMAPDEDPGLIVDVASLSLRRLIARANAFINANGRGAAAQIDKGAVQAEADAVMAD